MEDFEIPDWAKNLKKRYDKDPVKWMWIGMSSLVVVLVIGLVVLMVSNQKTNASAELSKGMLALQQGNYVAAIQSFEKIESSHRLSGFTERARLLKAAALFGLAKTEDAEKAYRDFIAENPSDELAAEATLGIGACLEVRGDTAGALKTYRDGAVQYSSSFLKKAFDIRIARLARETGDTETPAAIYDALEKDSEGLWKEIARGNRRMISLSQAAEEAASPTAASSAGRPAGQR